MIFNEYYNIEISLNGDALELSPNETYFQIHDSIHTLFSNAKITINDSFGMLREYMLANEGNILGVSYGIETLKNNLLQNSYVIESQETQNASQAGVLNGKIDLHLFHEFYNTQSVQNTAYNELISSIVEKLINTYKFKSTNIEKTQGKTFWYQLGMNQKEFICETLLPNSYNSECDSTPFFAFIDSNDCFNFTSYKTMMSANVASNLHYDPIKKDNSSIESIYDIKPFNIGSTKTRKLRNRTIFNRSTSTGEYTKKRDLMSSYPISKNVGAILPIIGNKDQITSQEYLSFNYTEVGKKESFKARMIRGQKDGFFLEKFIVTTPFNPVLTAGKTVNLDLTILNEKLIPEYSLYSSGKYLIEDCVHSWSGGTTKRGYTQLIVSRKYVEVPNTFKLKTKLMS